MRATSFVSLSTALLMSTAAVAEIKTAAADAPKTRAPAQTAQAVDAKVAPAQKQICKRLATTGSRMEERVCLTKDEWKLVEKEVEE